jgi:sodium transport system permease protein
VKTVAILKKELVDSLRDRRALLAALAFALIGPVLIVHSVNMTAAAGRETAFEPLRLCGAGDAPDLIAHLRSTGLAIADSARICLEVPADYAQLQAAGKTARVRVLADLTVTGPTTQKLEREINAHSRSLAAKRLMARGVAPRVVAPIAVEMQSTNPVSRMASLMGNALILYIVFAPFIIVYAMAGDTTAGERERHSLETLLTHPVSAAQIVAGKFLALAVVNLAGTALCVALSLVLVERSAMAELGFRVETSFGTGATVFLWLAPLCMLVAAAQLALGLFSKTAKEAQQTSMLVSLIPVVVGFMLLARPGLDVGAWPLAWELKALAGPLLGSTSGIAPFYELAAVELGVCVLILLAGARRLRSERVLG